MKRPKPSLEAQAYALIAKGFALLARAARRAGEKKPQKRQSNKSEWLPMEELERRILAVLPAESHEDAYRRAGIPHPRMRAGHAIRRLRDRGLVAWARGGKLVATARGQ